MPTEIRYCTKWWKQLGVQLVHVRVDDQGQCHFRGGTLPKSMVFKDKDTVLADALQRAKFAIEDTKRKLLHLEGRQHVLTVERQELARQAALVVSNEEGG